MLNCFQVSGICDACMRINNKDNDRNFCDSMIKEGRCELENPKTSKPYNQKVYKV